MTYHGAGAILLGLQSSGYVLLWSKELGTHPFASGRGEDVVEVKWKAGSVYCPGGGWFHQHFNTGSQPARHLALRYGSRIHPIGFKIADKLSELESALPCNLANSTNFFATANNGSKIGDNGLRHHNNLIRKSENKSRPRP